MTYPEVALVGERVAVVIPARDEAATIQATIAAVRTAVPSSVVVVVDDQSMDETNDLARASGAVVVETDPATAGLGAGMRLGIDRALVLGCGTIACIDADLQYDASDLSRLIAYHRNDEEALVVGNRLAYGRPIQMRHSRYLMNLGFSFVASLLLQCGDVIDFQSGMRVFSARYAPQLAHENNYTYTQEQLLRARTEGLRIVSVPIAFRRRDHGASRLVRSSAQYILCTIPHLAHVALRVGVPRLRRRT